ncbi:MAG: D-alanine--D-alanine ligase family protein [Halanaerobiaceae bacterium]
MEKINLGLVFGGRSAEHEISILSAASVYEVIDRDKYNIVPAAITLNGEWLGPDASRNVLEEKPDRVPERKKQRGVEGIFEFFRRGIDAVFPLLHGPFGEDGRIQGMLEMFSVPYVGCGVLGSALAMDKAVSKQVFSAAGLPQAEYMVLADTGVKKVINDNKVELVARIEREIGYPCFVKPANMGSSIGISRVECESEIEKAFRVALKYDSKLVVEEEVVGREIECSVLGNSKPAASLPGEIIPAADYYDFESKYEDEATKLDYPASLPRKKIEEVRSLAVKAFQVLNCSGMARVDFFLREEDGEFLLNEVNTIPGFTQYSMYPVLWEVTGLKYGDLIDKLVKLAFEAK